jgi:hypothetical protein
MEEQMPDQAPAPHVTTFQAWLSSLASAVLMAVVSAAVTAVTVFVQQHPPPIINVQPSPAPQVAPAPANPANSKLSADDVAKIVEALKAEAKK